MSYQRVIPRDLFNEAKLLKCMGMLSLAILDCKAPKHVEILDEHWHDGFEIGLSDDGLTIINMVVLIHRVPVEFISTYNSKANHPLFAVHDYVHFRVFDEEGRFDEEFWTLCRRIRREQKLEA